MTGRSTLSPVDVEDAALLVGACASPSEAFWRIQELAALRDCLHEFTSPVLEVGCGDGVFTQLTGVRVALGTDREARAVARAARQSCYDQVVQLDIHELDRSTTGRFATIYANSVFEHVPQVEAALSGAAQTLTPGGALITTLPLDIMNRNLLSARQPYVAWRQRQLEHRNLWSKAEWESRLRAAGFAHVAWHDYLPGAACRYWDRIDVVATLGVKRYRVAPALHRVAHHLIPHRTRAALKRRLGRSLIETAGALSSGDHCASVLVARTQT